MSNSKDTIKVWDPVVRIGHWTLVVAFFTAYFTEDDFLVQHVWAGYVVAAVVCIRVIWGFVGSGPARFGSFVRGPTAVFGYLRDLAARRDRRYTGHNPAGAAMIVMMLLALGGTVYSGLMVYALEENAGPFAAWVAAEPTTVRPDDTRIVEREDYDEREDFWEEAHEILANLSLLLVGLHVAGVLISSRFHNENLIKAMFTGTKNRDG